MPRTVSVAITANTSGFTAGMGKVSSSAKSAASSVSAAFGKGLDGIGKNKRNLDTLSNGLGKVGIVAGLGVGLAVKSFADFDKAMSSVAATGSDARGSLEQLREAAIKAGNDTQYSATEAAGGVEALAKAGVSAKDTLGGGLKGALNLAAAGNLGVAGSAEAAASAMNQFGLSGADIPHIADLLAQSAGTAQGEVSDMAAALNQSGLVANQFGLSIDETAQSLALFAKNGLVGSDAGTSFKTMLTSLYAPAGTAKKALDQLGVSAYDASGAIKPIGVVTDELKAKLDQLSEGDRNSALKNIFGSDAIRAGTILLKDGSQGLANMATEFGKFGSAADVARIKMDNLKGDVEQLTGSLETLLIKGGAGANDGLRGLTQGATGAVNAFGSLPDVVQQGVVVFAGFGAAALLGVAGLGKIAVAAVEARTAIAELSLSGSVAARGLGAVASVAGPVGLALAAVAAGFEVLSSYGSKIGSQDAISAQLVAIATQGDAAAASMTALSAAFPKPNAADITLNALSGPLVSMVPQATNLADALDQVTNAGLGTNNWLAKVVSAVTPGQQGFEKTTAGIKATDDALTQLVTSGHADQAAAAFKQINDEATARGLDPAKVAAQFSGYTAAAKTAADAVTEQGNAAADAAAKTDPAAYQAVGDALQALTNNAKSSAAENSQLATSLFESGDAAQNAVAAHAQYAAAIDDANAAIEKNGATLNKSRTALSDSTAKGRENIGVLNNLASAGKGYVQSLAAQGASQREVVKATKGVRSEFIAAADSAGLTAKQAGKLADSFGLIPKKVSIKFDAIGLALQQQKVEEFKTALKGLTATQQAKVGAVYDKRGAAAALRELNKLNGIHAKPKVTVQTDLGKLPDLVARMARLKDKKVKAIAAGDTAGAARVDAAMKRLKNRIVKAVTKGDTGGASKVDGAMRRLKDKLVKAITRGDLSGARSAAAAIAAVRSKTVTITVRRQNVGKAGGVSPGFASGGHVTGPGTPTSDSIPAWLSDGEFIVRAAAVKAVGLHALNAINAKGYADGGQVQRFAKGGKAAKISNEEKVLRVIIAQHNLDEAKTIAERVAASKHLDAVTKKLADSLSQAAEAARTTATALAEPYKSKSHDIDDWLTSMKEGAADLGHFKDQVAELRKLGLSQTLIQSITDQGALVGSELADQILAGGKGLADSLNQANKDLTKAADAVGVGVIGVKGHAAGGPISGPGTATSDSITARLSNGEYVVNAAATAANRSVLDAINYGRTAVGHRFTPAYAQGGYVPRAVVTKEIRGGDVIITGNQIVDPAKLLRQAKNGQRDSMTMLGLSRSL